MRFARTKPACCNIFICSLAVGWLTRSFFAMNTPHTPSLTRSPYTCGGKCFRGFFSQARICSRLVLESARKRRFEIHIDT